MDKQSSITHKDLWNNIFPYIGMSDYFAFEICNRNFKSILHNHYQLKTKNFEEAAYPKNPKKTFFSIFKNSFVIFNVKDEFNSLIESEEFKTINGDSNENKNKKPKTDIIKSQTIYNTQKNQENTIFSQSNMISQIIVKEKIFILYQNGDFKIFNFITSDKFELEIKFDFSSLKFKKFIYMDQISTILFINSQGKLFSLSFPTKSDVTEIKTINNLQSKTTLIEIENIKTVTDIYSLTEYIIVIDDSENIFYIQINNLKASLQSSKTEHKQSEEKEKIKLISFDKNYEKILKISRTDENLMFIDSKYRVFYINSNDLNKPGTVERSPKLIHDHNFKMFRDLSCGDNHWLVLEREDLEPLHKWNQSEVQEWFIRMEMDEYVNIIKYEKIKGIDILEGDELFFINVMGLKDDQYRKLKYEINKVKNVTSRKSTLWGWGSNKFGQLGQINYNNCYTKNPTIINLPEMKDEDDYIVNIYCGKTFSLLLTKFGEVYITGNYLVKEKAASFIQSTSINLKVKGDKKHKTPMKSKVVTQTSIQHRWVNITRQVCFDSVNNKTTNNEYFFKVKEIFLRGTNIFFLGYKSNEIPFTLQEKKPKFKHFKIGEKFPTSDSIIEHILAKKKILIDKISIVYDDSILKFLETSLEEFLESEVPYHKLIQIKFFNIIIWDRKKRYYKLEFE